MKSSPSIWRYVVNVKLTVKISSIFVAFLDNMNFNMLHGIFLDQTPRSGFRGSDPTQYNTRPL